MSISYSLFKARLRKTIIDSIYNEVVYKTARYYHWLGKENSWTDFLSPFIPSSTTDIPGPPQNNFRYDLHVRRDILTAKAITSSDVSYVVPRIDWTYGTTYDMYDDAYTTPIDTAIQWQAGLAVTTDAIIKHDIYYYRVVNSGTLGDTAPTHTTGTDSNGNVSLYYFTRDEVAYSGATSLETAQFYVLTSDYNVYKCIWNNENSPSLVMPTGVSTDIITTSDRYKWKFLYNIPVSLRNRFLSTTWMPVSTALKSQFFSNGQFENVIIDNPGIGYSEGDNVIVTGDGYIENNPYRITDFTIIQGGLGYTGNPVVTFANPDVISGDEILAEGTVTASGGIVNARTLTVAGYGYSQAPTVTAAEPIAYQKEWASNDTVNLNDVLRCPVDVIISNEQFTQYIYYKVTSVTSGTSTGATAPTHITGAQTNGQVELTVIAKRAILRATVVKTEAELSLVVNPTNGEITNVLVVDGGVGYTNANIQITAATPVTTAYVSHTGTTLNVTSTLNIYKGMLVTGTGFTSNQRVFSVVDGDTVTLTAAPDTTPSGNLTFSSNGTEGVLLANFNVGNVNTVQANTELFAVPGSIEVIKVVDQGSGYGTATVNILGDGTGATAEAVITSGRITGINIITPGIGYTWTDVQIIGNGTGALVRAIMSPIRGHGWNAINELNANSLMFYSSISRDKNQGIEINNDYRKVGLLKDPREYSPNGPAVGRKFTADIGSGCVLVTATFNKANLLPDMLLVKDEYKKYRIVDFNDTQILLSVFNNFTINPGDILITETGYSITVESVQERTIDQFSGDLLFISVRESFEPKAEQIITLRTVITI